jgi:hypothetical protein
MYLAGMVYLDEADEVLGIDEVEILQVEMEKEMEKEMKEMAVLK